MPSIALPFTRSAVALGIAFASLAGVPATARAALPLVTLDATVLEHGACEADLAMQRLAVSGGPSASAWQARVGCGTVARTQWTAGWTQSNDRRQSSLGLSGKTRLLGTPGHTGQLSLAYGLDTLRDKDTGSDHEVDALHLGALWSAPLAHGWALHANLGLVHQRQPSATDAAWALAIAHQFSDQLSLTAEAWRRGDEKAWAALGLRWQLTPALGLSAWGGSQSSSPRVKRTGLGLTIGF